MGTILRFDLPNSLLKVWSADKTKTHYLERATEVAYSYCNEPNPNRRIDFSDAADFLLTLWECDQTQIHHLQKSAELRELALDEGISTHDLGWAAKTYRLLWQADPSQTHHFLKALGFFEQRCNLLAQMDEVNVFIHAWYCLQHSRIDPAQAHRREEAKALWQQALQMGLSREKMDTDYQAFFDTLSSEFGEGNAELWSEEGRGIQA